MTTSEPIWKRLRETVAAVLEHLPGRSDRAPIDSIDRLTHFARTRAAYVGQHKLYGYVKTRMGHNYPKMFKDDTFIASLNFAKIRVVAACLSDMSCYVAALAARGDAWTDDERRDLARRCFQTGISALVGEEADPLLRAEWLKDFQGRLAQTDWQGEPTSFFTESPRALIRWAPIADELKRYDVEIVKNSIRFAWTEVRSDFSRRLDAAAIRTDHLERHDQA